MKRTPAMYLVMTLSVLSLNCLKAKKSPFDISKPSTLAGVAGYILNQPNSGTSSILPSVSSTLPSDSATGVTANAKVEIVFNIVMDKTTITTNSNDTTCSGTVQISFDNFTSCVKMRPTISTTDNKTFTLTSNPTMGTFTTHKIKVTTGARSETKSNLEKDYSQSTGFTTTIPCTVFDAQSCPIPFSSAATLNKSLSNGALIIPIDTGAAKGKILVVMGANASTSTNIFNPETGVFTAGANLTGPVNTSESSDYFFIKSGAHSGKVLIIHGGNTTTSIYDSELNSMIAGPNLTANPFPSVNSFLISSGIHSGKTMVVLVGGSNATNLYDPIANTFSVGPNIVPGTPNPAQGSHNVTITSGANSGKTIVVYGGLNPTTSIYDPSTNAFSAGPNLTAGSGIGAKSFLLTSGLQAGNIITAHGNSLSSSSIINSNSLNSSPGQSLTGNPINNPGTHGLLINSGALNGKLWIINGFNGFTSSTSSLYDFTTDTVSTGINMLTNCGEGSKTVFIESGVYANKYMSFYGSKSITSFYDPVKNAIDPSSLLPSSAGAGINKIEITSGTNSGKILVINGGSNSTSLFDFTTGTFSTGPNLTGVMGRSPGLFTISGGAQEGKALVIHGGNSTGTSLYDPSLNTFSAGPSLSASSNNIASNCTYKIPSGAQIGKYLIIHANTSSSTSLYDPATHSISAGPVTGATMGPSAVICFPILSGVNAGKFIVTQGTLSATSSRMYDPTTNAFSAGPALANGVTNNSFAIPINTGKVLLIIGSGTTTNIYDPITHTFSAGPSLSASTTDGAYLFLANGINKNKYIIFHGTTSSIYNPDSNTITSGLAISEGSNFSSLAFNISSGLFNQGVLLINGNGNVTSILYP